MVEFKIKRKEILKLAKSRFKRLEKTGLSTWNGRQIRSASQMAIALAECEARQPGAETPFLGKAQFEIIAEASEEFDRYLKHTLGDVDADLARKEGIRSDYYGIQAVGKAPSVLRTALRTGRRNGRDLESDLKVPSQGREDDDDDDEDDDEEDEEDENSKQIKATSSSSSKSATTGGTKEESGEDGMEAAFKKFLQSQKMAKKGKRTFYKLVKDD